MNFMLIDWYTFTAWSMLILNVLCVDFINYIVFCLLPTFFFLSCLTYAIAYLITYYMKK